MDESISGLLPCEKALLLNQKSQEILTSRHAGRLGAFRLRHRIRELHVEGKTLSGDSNVANKVGKKFSKLLEKEEYSRDDVYNADETGINGRALPEKSREARAPRFRASKERVAAMVCANASGKHILVIASGRQSQETTLLQKCCLFANLQVSEESLNEFSVIYRLIH